MTLRVMMCAPGPSGHGVVRHAGAVSSLVRAAGAEVVGSAEEADVIHAHFTDAIWGPNIDAAAERFASWAARQWRPIVVTVHDAPHADDEPARRLRRRAGFGRVLAASDAAIVAYRSEAEVVRSLTSRPVWTIELPLDTAMALPTSASVAATGAVASDPDGPAVGVLGFLFPGKGHREILAATAAAGMRRVVRLGGTSPGHRQLADEVAGDAALLGITLEVTGEISNEDLCRRITEIAVPVWAATGVNASGSLVSWIAHHRRPIAVARPVSEEVARRHPGCLTLVAPSGLADAIRTAAGVPESTWINELPIWSPVGELHLRAYCAAAW